MQGRKTVFYVVRLSSKLFLHRAEKFVYVLIFQIRSKKIRFVLRFFRIFEFIGGHLNGSLILKTVLKTVLETVRSNGSFKTKLSVVFRPSSF